LTQTLINYNPIFIENKIDNVIIATTSKLAITNRLLTDGFSSFTSLDRFLSNGSLTQFQILEKIKSLAAAVSSGFLNIKFPCNLVTDSLLSGVEKQYSTYLNHMTIQMAAQSNNIFQDLFDKMEKQTGVAWRA
jgi:hypothetical protein